jgi:hypothetical protein
LAHAATWWQKLAADLYQLELASDKRYSLFVLSVSDEEISFRKLTPGKEPIINK